MDDPTHLAGHWPVVEVAELERREADLRHKLERCVPPVDQHRREFERVRAELEAVRAVERDQTT